MELHERLTAARIAAGFASATDAAAALGVVYSTYAGHENGSSGFRAATGEKYARKFKVRFEWLMREIGPMKADAEPTDLDEEWAGWEKELREAGQLETAKAIVRALLSGGTAAAPPPSAEGRDASKANKTR